LEGPATQVTGDLNLDFAGAVLATGSLEGKSRDLSFISLFVKEKIGGRAQFTARLAPGDSGQEIRLTIKGGNLVTRFGEARDLQLVLHLSNVFQKPAVTGDITISDVQRDDLSFSMVKLNVRGDGQRIAFSSLLIGRQREAFEIKTDGIVEISPGSHYVEIRSLQGNYGGYAVNLTQTARIRRSGGDLSIQDLALNLGPGHFEASGVFESRAVTFSATLDNLPLEPFRLLGSPDFTGSVSGDIRLTGSPDRPEGSVVLRSTGVRLTETGLRNLPPATVQVTINLKGGIVRAVFSVEGVTLKPIEAEVASPLAFSLSPPSMSLPPHGKLQGRVSASADLARILSFYPLEDQTLEGSITVDLVLAGTLEAPETSGLARIERASFENVRTGTIIKDIDIEITAEQQRMTITRGRATDGEQGVILATGWLEVSPTKSFPLQVDLDLDGTTLVRQDRATAELGGEVSLSGSMRKLLVSGKLRVGPAELQIPDRVGPAAAEIEVIEVNKPGGSPSPESTPGTRKYLLPQLDLEIDLPGRVFLRGRGLDSEWRGTLRITGPAHAPMITGVLSIVRGRFNMFGKNLALKKGTLTFDGSVPPAPVIDLFAESTRGDMTARIALSGTPSALNITLESDPPLPSDEILSRLLFGRGVTDVTPVQAVKLTWALGALTGASGGVLDFFERTRKLVGVDQFDIKESEDGSGETAVSVGKYLRDDVYVEVEKGVGTTRGKLSVEYDVTPNVSVETEAGADAQGGIGFNWKWDY
jgi:translocation and assembly module TamB